MKNLGQMLKQAQEMQGRMAEMQERLAATELAGSAGGDMVRVVLNGRGELKRVSIDPSLMTADDRQIVEDLLVAAHADARSRLDGQMQDEMQKLTGGLPLPPGFKLPF